MNANSKCKASKCFLFTKTINYFEHVVSNARIAPEHAEFECFEQLTLPTTGKEIASFFGICNYCYSCTRNYFGDAGFVYIDFRSFGAVNLNTTRGFSKLCVDTWRIMSSQLVAASASRRSTAASAGTSTEKFCVAAYAPDTFMILPQPQAATQQSVSAPLALEIAPLASASRHIASECKSDIKNNLDTKELPVDMMETSTETLSGSQRTAEPLAKLATMVTAL